MNLIQRHHKCSIIQHWTHLVLASRSSGSIAWLGVSGTRLGLSTLGHHDGEVNIRADRILVTGLTRVDSRGIGGVSVPGLEWVEVTGGAGGVRVPPVVNILLGIVVPKLLVVVSIFVEEPGGRANSKGSRSEGVGSSYKGDKGKGLGVLCVTKKANRRKISETSVYKETKIQPSWSVRSLGTVPLWRILS